MTHYWRKNKNSLEANEDRVFHISACNKRCHRSHRVGTRYLLKRCKEDNHQESKLLYPNWVCYKPNLLQTHYVNTNYLEFTSRTDIKISGININFAIITFVNRESSAGAQLIFVGFSASRTWWNCLVTAFPNHQKIIKRIIFLCSNQVGCATIA